MNCLNNLLLMFKIIEAKKNIKKKIKASTIISKVGFRIEIQKIDIIKLLFLIKIFEKLPAILLLMLLFGKKFQYTL